MKQIFYSSMFLMIILLTVLAVYVSKYTVKPLPKIEEVKTIELPEVIYSNEGKG